MDFQEFNQLWKQTLANDFIIIETSDFVRTKKKKKELKPMKDFVKILATPLQRNPYQSFLEKQCVM